MSIDMSSAIPMIHTTDIKINKEEESQRVRPVEGSSESGNTGLQLNKEGFTEMIVSDSLTGVGDTYSTKGELVKEVNSRPNGGNRNMTIDMMI